MSFLIRQTLIYAVPLMIVALAGIFAERSGVINLALEGIMIFGAFIGVLCVRMLQVTPVFEAAKAAGSFWGLQGLMFLAMLAAALLAVNNPIAVIFTGIFMSMLDIAGLQLTNLTAYNEYITDVIIAVIVYLAAFSLVIKLWLGGKKKSTQTATAEVKSGTAKEGKK